jgi:hypothetical protein
VKYGVSKVRGPLGGIVNVGSFDEGSHSLESYLFTQVDSATVDLTIIIF